MIAPAGCRRHERIALAAFSAVPRFSSRCIASNTSVSAAWPSLSANCANRASASFFGCCFVLNEFGYDEPPRENVRQNQHRQVRHALHQEVRQRRQFVGNDHGPFEQGRFQRRSTTGHEDTVSGDHGVMRMTEEQRQRQMAGLAAVQPPRTSVAFREWPAAPGIGHLKCFGDTLGSLDEGVGKEAQFPWRLPGSNAKMGRQPEDRAFRVSQHDLGSSAGCRRADGRRRLPECRPFVDRCL